VCSQVEKAAKLIILRSESLLHEIAHLVIEVILLSICSGINMFEIKSITPLTSFNTFAIGEKPVGSETSKRRVLKRDGRTVDWERSRIERALRLAYENTPLDSGMRLQGDALQQKIARLAEGVEWAVWHRFGEEEPVSIEAIQDVAETCLAAAGDWEVARAYVRYRTVRAERRPRRHMESGLQEYIAVSRYARYRSDLGRREIWPESVSRVRDMHLRRFAHSAAHRPNPDKVMEVIKEQNLSESEQAILVTNETLYEEIWQSFDAVQARKVLPSMRSLQFGGAAIEANEARIYNCSFSHANRVEFFRECFYLLLSGVGVGFSAQKHHVRKIPVFPERAPDNELPVRHFAIGDSIDGWSDAVDALFRSHYEGWLAEFNYSLVRARGKDLKTSGGKAPGHLPLKASLIDIGKVLRRAAGRHLRPIEVYDIVMFIARAVLAGGIRRSATICLFSPDDEEMANAKTGNWFEENPQRAYSNNSALIVREKAEREVFNDLFRRIRESGEPGFYFAENEEYGANPCVEIGLCPMAKVDADAIARLRALGYRGALKEGDVISGWQMCNLTTVNGAVVDSPERFLEACRHASLLGTLQAAYTKIDYLGPVTRFLNEREALLGVSLCGVLDRPEILLRPEVLQAGARMVKATNALFADLLGIQPAARTTCVKPEGTASLLLGAGSGIHPHHAQRYFRRVQVNRMDPVYNHFKRKNPHMSEVSVYNPQTDDVISFPVEAPEGALCREDVNALTFLDHVLVVQKNWVEAGTAVDQYNPGLYHNVSNTVTVKDQEWLPVADLIWEQRQHFTGVALLADSGDKSYRQAPRESLSTPEDVVRWNQLIYEPVDYREMAEADDQTRLADVAACAGGACELI
jgi:ribonucleoside-triphosphate reductase